MLTQSCFPLSALELPPPSHSLLAGLMKHPPSQRREGARGGRKGEESKFGVQHPIRGSGAGSEAGGSRPKGYRALRAESDLESGAESAAGISVLARLKWV